MPPVSELVFRRAAINLNDAARLGEGEDLNDALLDFFVRLGQSIIPKNGENEAPVCYLGALFFKQLTSAFVTSGEEGWKNVQNWAKRKQGGMFKPNYAAFAVPINEELKDDKGEPAGNHWWLALLLNPPGGARGESTAVMCLDSMQRREKAYDPPLESAVEGSRNGYTLKITKVEQAGYLLIVSFDARGDGSMGPLPRPEKSWLEVDGCRCTNPELGLRINMGGGDDVAGRFEGTLTFALDGQIRSSSFMLHYAGVGFKPVRIEFDPFMLTKWQKVVSRYLGGYLGKEWLVNGPQKTVKFEKQSARALVADVHQQENLNDCGVFVLENTLRALSMKQEFLKELAGASPKTLKSFPWPTQNDITNRKLKLKAIVARLFEIAAEKGTSDVEVLLKGNEALKKECFQSLTDDREGELDKWSNKLQEELAARTVDKAARDKELAEREAAVQARRDEERRKREEEEERRKAEEREFGKQKPTKPKDKDKEDSKKKKRKGSSGSSRSASPPKRAADKSKQKEKEKQKAKKPAKRGSSDGSDGSRSRSPPQKAKKGAKAGKRGRSRSVDKKASRNGKKKGGAPSDSRSGSADSRSPSPRDKRKRR
eukprot:TRINITY_DN13487_c0_g1_i1.p1 TRINITY_DN13487_c0_g1~~TRINITY_DN13487_c0_g1_i1.p1  ORF type:complete len:626 (-),score=147.79 TRINITY_DN13487_c0_g1_i1:159-1952(-)